MSTDSKKIIFLSRKTLFDVPGGDTIQILKTAEVFRKQDQHVDVSTEMAPNVYSYDMVHLFNLMRPQEVYLQALNAKKKGKKIALSTIYGPYTEYDRKARKGISKLLSNILSHNQIEYLKILARAVINREINMGTWMILSRGHKGLQKKLVEIVDVFLPNSESEMQRVHTDFPKSKSKPYVTVPNAVDTRLFDFTTVEASKEVEKYRDCILSVARIEGRKCQLDLVRAMKSLPDKQLVLIGKPAPNHFSFYEQIQREAGSNVHLLGQIDHSLLPEFYKVASVHCLISWMETPGLSSLEAGVMGCNLVITDKGDTRDYFGDYAYYCEPDSVASIRTAILAASSAPFDPALRQHILNNYTWEKAADKTMEGYQAALNERRIF